MTKTHINRAYNSELQLLRDRILLIAGRVEKMIGKSLPPMEEKGEEHKEIPKEMADQIAIMAAQALALGLTQLDRRSFFMSMGKFCSSVQGHARLSEAIHLCWQDGT